MNRILPLLLLVTLAGCSPGEAPAPTPAPEAPLPQRDYPLSDQLGVYDEDKDFEENVFEGNAPSLPPLCEPCGRYICCYGRPEGPQ
jgi:hypothetical protein